MHRFHPIQGNGPMVKNCAMEETAKSSLVITMPPLDDWSVEEEEDTGRRKIEMLGYTHCIGVCMFVGDGRLGAREGKVVEEGTETRVNLGGSKSETVKVKTNKNREGNMQDKDKEKKEIEEEEDKEEEETNVVEFEGKKDGGEKENKNGECLVVNVDVKKEVEVELEARAEAKVVERRTKVMKRRGREWLRRIQARVKSRLRLPRMRACVSKTTEAL
ncbi:hypothetical protein EGR_11244 [Echinococcus granulosus]|uniref:Uncharacterized protein n=1 Tax=Echinococcus granulosus TaxID=6210 RepID=W6UK60_ECHGR|nr:hypothetical protein EGR_11244 [Echinococcus granulosus]EUB53899.1 hypothetical protein EGR_11244 [Echinococcus granulosus]